MTFTSNTLNISVPAPQTFAYLRVSTTDQEHEKNKADILALANSKKLGHVEFIEDTVSGTVEWEKRKIAKIMTDAHKGDSVIVSELSRLGRSMLDVLSLIRVATQKGVNIYAVKNNWVLDDSPQSKMVAAFISMAAEIERDLISQRTKEALRARKEQGIPLGRPKGIGKSKLDTHRVEIEALLVNGSTQKFIAERYGTTEANLHHWMKQRGLGKKKGNPIMVKATHIPSTQSPLLNVKI